MAKNYTMKEKIDMFLKHIF